MACACKNKKQNAEAPKQEAPKTVVDSNLEVKKSTDTFEAPNGEKVTITKVD